MGLISFRKSCEDKYGSSFENCTVEERIQFILSLELEANSYKENRKPEEPDKHYYTMFKQLTVLGFLTSEVGATKALRHVAVPGRYEACIPLEKGQKAWS
jgi:hypothetical protein